jgi:tRNA G10  N-methylase Trm11
MKHPAKFSNSILDLFANLLHGVDGLLLDPFAGTGRIHELARTGLVTVGVELEHEWAGMHTRTICGDALRLPFPDKTFNVIATSPTYGNRLADHHEAKDGSTRHSYTHDLGRTLHKRNSGVLAFGDRYQKFHTLAWAESVRVLKDNGLMIVNVSDFVRGGQVVPVVEWHRQHLAAALHLYEVEHFKVATRRLRYGANNKVRVEGESILVFKKEPKWQANPFNYRRSAKMFINTSMPHVATVLPLTMTVS